MHLAGDQNPTRGFPALHEPGSLAPSTALGYRSQVDVHLVPYFRNRDLREIGLRDVQAFYGHCVDRGRPRSRRTIDMVIGTLGMIFAHAVRSGIIEANPVDTWKTGRKRRRRPSLPAVSEDKVLSHEELVALLKIARRVFALLRGPREHR